MLERLKELEEKKSSIYETFKEEYDKVLDEFQEELINNLPYLGKYIKAISYYSDIYTYIKVREIFKHKAFDGSPIVILRGYGFKSEITSYCDATYMEFSGMMTHELYLNKDLEEELSRITEINENEFKEQFYNTLSQVQARVEEVIDNKEGF